MSNPIFDEYFKNNPLENIAPPTKLQRYLQNNPDKTISDYSEQRDKVLSGTFEPLQVEEAGYAIPALKATGQSILDVASLGVFGQAPNFLGVEDSPLKRTATGTVEVAAGAADIVKNVITGIPEILTWDDFGTDTQAFYHFTDSIMKANPSLFANPDENDVDLPFLGPVNVPGLAGSMAAYAYGIGTQNAIIASRIAPALAAKSTKFKKAYDGIVSIAEKYPKSFNFIQNAIDGGLIDFVSSTGEGQTRLGNVALGAAMGGTITAFLEGVPYLGGKIFDGINKAANYFSGAERKAANSFVEPDASRPFVGPQPYKKTAEDLLKETEAELTAVGYTPEIFGEISTALRMTRDYVEGKRTLDEVTNKIFNFKHVDDTIKQEMLDNLSKKPGEISQKTTRSQEIPGTNDILRFRNELQKEVGAISLQEAANKIEAQDWIPETSKIKMLEEFDNISKAYEAKLPKGKGENIPQEAPKSKQTTPPGTSAEPPERTAARQEYNRALIILKSEGLDKAKEYISEKLKGFFDSSYEERILAELHKKAHLAKTVNPTKLEAEVDRLSELKDNATNQADFLRYSEELDQAIIELNRATVPQAPKTEVVNSMRESYDGSTVYEIDPKEIVSETGNKIQYKLDASSQGIADSGSLEGVGFDKNFAGQITVFRNPENGKLTVINGHNRLKLAIKDNAPLIRVKEVKANSIADAKRIGALENIAEGQGTPYDAAKFILDNNLTVEDLKKLNIYNLQNKIIVDALRISKVAQDILDMARIGMDDKNSIFYTSRAARTKKTEVNEKINILAEMLPNDFDRQRFVVDLLLELKKNGENPTNEQFVELVKEAKFGEAEVYYEDTLFKPDKKVNIRGFWERAVITNAISKDISANLNDYKKASSKRLQEKEGVDIDTKTVSKKKAEIETISELWESNKPYKGILHEKITEYGEKLASMKDNKATAEEKDAFIKKTVKEIKEYIYGNQKELRIISEPVKANEGASGKPEQQSIKETPGAEEPKLETGKDLTPEEIKQAEIDKKIAEAEANNMTLFNRGTGLNSAISEEANTIGRNRKIPLENTDKKTNALMDYIESKWEAKAFVTLQEIRDFVKKNLEKFKVRLSTKGIGEGARGRYSPGVIGEKNIGDLDTFVHENAHDARLTLLGKREFTQAEKTELEQIFKRRPAELQVDEENMLEESFADFLTMYVRPSKTFNPEEYPNLFRAINEAIKSGGEKQDYGIYLYELSVMLDKMARNPEQFSAAATQGNVAELPKTRSIIDEFKTNPLGFSLYEGKKLSSNALKWIKDKTSSANKDWLDSENKLKAFFNLDSKQSKKQMNNAWLGFAKGMSAVISEAGVTGDRVLGMNGRRLNAIPLHQIMKTYIKDLSEALELEGYMLALRGLKRKSKSGMEQDASLIVELAQQGRYSQENFEKISANESDIVLQGVSEKALKRTLDYVNADPAKKARFDATAKEITNLGNEYIRDGIRMGVINADEAKILQDEIWRPFSRILEDGRTAEDGLNTIIKGEAKRLEGSNKLVDSMYNSFGTYIRDLYSRYHKAYISNLVLEVLPTVEKSGFYGEKLLKPVTVKEVDVDIIKKTLENLGFKITENPGKADIGKLINDALGTAEGQRYAKKYGNIVQLAFADKVQSPNIIARLEEVKTPEGQFKTQQTSEPKKRYEMVYYEIAPELFNAIDSFGKSFNANDIENKYGRTAVKSMQGTTDTLKKGAILLSLAFQLRNPLRDSFTFALNTRTKGWDWVRDLSGGKVEFGTQNIPLLNLYHFYSATKDLYEDTELAKKFMDMGVGKSNYITSLMSTMEDTGSKIDLLLPKKDGKMESIIEKAKHPLKTAEDLSKWTESPYRMYEFKNKYLDYIKEGKTEEEAAILAAKDAKDVTTPFYRMGEMGQKLNTVTAFFNPTVQSFYQAGLNAIENKPQFAVRFLATTFAPVFLSYALNRGKNWYKNRSEQEKRDYIFFDVNDILRPMGLGTKDEIVMKLPIPNFDLGSAAYDIISNMDSLYKEGKVKMDINEISKSAGNFIYNLVAPDLIKIFTDVYIKNTNFFGGKIVSEYFQRLPIEKQKMEYTTKGAEIASKAFNSLPIPEFLELSPIQMDYIFNSFSGGVTNNISSTYRFLSALAEGKQTNKTDIPGVGPLFLRYAEKPTGQAEEYYKIRDELNKKKISETITKQEEKALDAINRYYKGIKEIQTKIKDSPSEEKKKSDYRALQKEYENALSRAKKYLEAK